MPATPRELEGAERLNRLIVQRALRVGTCTGEHGIGLHKMHVLVEECGLPAMDPMRPIQRALDPSNRLNPGNTCTGDASEPAHALAPT